MTWLHSIRAVTFDVGGTLIEPWPSVGDVYAEVAGRHGLKGISPESLNRQFAAAWRNQKNFKHSQSEWAELVKTTFQGFTDSPPTKEMFADLYARFAEPSAWRIFDDVLATLDALASGGFKLGVISNWDERLRPLLRQLKLCDYFEAIIVSHDVGFAKPSPLIFQHAAEKLALAPGAILHVGDSPEMDVEGARASGFQAVELRRKSAASSAAELSSLRSLETWLPALSHA